MHSRLRRSNMIGNAQSAAPVRRSYRPLDRAEQRLRVGIRNRKDGNFGELRRILDFKSLGSRQRSPARRKWIAGEVGVGHGAALHRIFVAPRALWIYLAL